MTTITCPNCNAKMRFSRTIFADRSEIWRCDDCGQEVAIPPADEEPIIVARGPVVSLPAPVDLDAAFAERYGPDDDEAIDDTLIVQPDWREEFRRKLAKTQDEH